MLSWLVIFFASSSPQGIDQGVTLSALRVTLSALRVTAWVRVGPNLLGQGIVLSANKTASASREHLLRSRSALDDALNAVGLFARRTWASRPRGSEILSRKRRMTLPMIRRIHEEYGAPPEILIQDYPLEPTGSG